VSSAPSPFDVSIVSAVYDVARFLPEFTASLEAQRGVDLSRVQVIAVDDGSTDSSLSWLQDWARRSPLAVTVLTKENGGQGSARNLGLTVAEGTWVTFTDPDDTLEPHYLQRVLAFAAAHPEAEMLGTARWMHNDATGAITDTHPLKHMFTEDVLVDLDTSLRHFHGSAPAAFFRLERLRSTGLQFDHRIQPNFEDGYFCTRYVLDCPRPLVGFVASAVYHYRKRSDQSSTLNTSLTKPNRFTVVPRLGYLDVLQRSADQRGRAAAWVQNFVLYELSWYFSSEASMAGAHTANTGPVAEQFVQTLREIVALLDPERVEGFNLRTFESAWRDGLLHGVAGEDWHARYAVVFPRDRMQQLVRVINRFTGVEPAISYVVDGQPVEPVHTKVRSHVYFDHDLVQERIAWVPLGEDLDVLVDGHRVEQVKKWPRPAPPLEAPEGWRTTRWGRRVTNPGRALGSARRRATRNLLTHGLPARRYRDAWVLMDRIHDADDSGEHLFRHLRAHRPDINAWFVVEKGTPDWRRLRPEFGRRVVAHDSLPWLALMLNCLNLVSSHVDKPVHRPDRVLRLAKNGKPPWRFSFLQHGVIKDDLSRWLNPKAVHLFVTSTAAEQESVAGDHTQYAYTTREAKLTGLPRFDRLLAAADEVSSRDLVLVAPTWRQWLMPPLQPGSQRRVLNEDFLHTDYARNWLGLVTSERVAELCAAHGVQVGFLPHPNLQSVLDLVELPPHVVPLSFTDNNVQQLFARAAVLVTDYSSMAFNAAYLDRAVVYFQFDADVVQAGGHVGRAGYFDYARDGFGPVVEDLGGAVDAIADVLAQGSRPAPEYLARNASTFLLRDGRCCERVTAAIEGLHRPWSQG
jgi:glycosyltransferase involved in cell wall biosynthesis